jgi:hypothetical protein
LAASWLTACSGAPRFEADGATAPSDATTDTGGADVDATIVDAESDRTLPADGPAVVVTPDGAALDAFDVGAQAVADGGDELRGGGAGDGEVADSSAADSIATDTGPADAGLVDATGDAGPAEAAADSGPPDAASMAPWDVLTQHNDNRRTGAFLNESTLTVANVRASSFGKLFARAVDDQIYAQPLLMRQVTIPGRGVHDVLYVATMNDTVYAFDADDPNQSAPLWKTSFLDADAGVVPVSRADVGLGCVFMNISGNIGIESTPVIDPIAGRMYVVAKTKNASGVQTYTLHALDVATGLDQVTPVSIRPSAPGAGAGSDGGTIPFDASVENQRGSLLLANGKVYFTFGSYCESGNYHGWLLAYDAVTLAPYAAYISTPNGIGGGIWMSGQGPSADANGNVYVAASGGTTDVNTGGTDTSESLLKLTPSLTVTDWFVPYNYATLTSSGNFYGSAGVLLVPQSTLAVSGSETGELYVNDTSSLGQFNMSSDSQIAQSLQLGGSEVHGSPVALGNLVYVWAAGDALRRYQVSGGALTQAQVGPATLSTGQPGGILSLSSNGTTPATGILWVSQPASGDASQSTVPGILQAFDASNVATEIWDSHLTSGDDCGAFAKFTAPTVANGKVYLPSFANQVCVYGAK